MPQQTASIWLHPTAVKPQILAALCQQTKLYPQLEDGHMRMLPQPPGCIFIYKHQATKSPTTTGGPDNAA